MQDGIESIGEFVISRGDTAELLEPIEEALNEVACLVAMPVDGALDLSVATRRDVGLGTTFFNMPLNHSQSDLGVSQAGVEQAHGQF